jgi:hypothetical protein
MKWLKNIIEFPAFAVLAIGMVLGPALPYVVALIAATLALGIFIGVLL